MRLLLPKRTQETKSFGVKSQRGVPSHGGRGTTLRGSHHLPLVAVAQRDDLLIGGVAKHPRGGRELTRLGAPYGRESLELLLDALHASQSGFFRAQAGAG